MAMPHARISATAVAVVRAQTPERLRPGRPLRITAMTDGPLIKSQVLLRRAVL